MLAIPEAPLEYLAQIHHAPKPHVPHLVLKSIEQRRTIAPVLLTFGAGLIAFCITRFLCNHDCNLYFWPAWLCVLLGVLGLLIIVVAAATMMSIQAQLASGSVPGAAAQ